MQICAVLGKVHVHWGLSPLAFEAKPDGTVGTPYLNSAYCLPLTCSHLSFALIPQIPRLSHLLRDDEQKTAVE